MVFWIGLGLAVWLYLAVLVALLVGKMIRQRHGQWHHLDEPSTARAHSQMAAHDGMTNTRPIELVRGAHAPPTTARAHSQMAAHDGTTDTRPVELVRGAHAPPTTHPSLMLQPRLVPAGREMARRRHVTSSPLLSR